MRRVAAGFLVLGLLSCAQRVVPRTRPVPVLAPTERVNRLILIGDAGASVRDEPVLQALGRDLAADPQHTLVVFLGDNIYPRGLVTPGTPGHAEAERRLFAQVDVVRASGARGVLIPGNHDWDRSGPDGWNAVRRQAQAVEERGGGRVRFEPREGCPGPVLLDEGPWLRLVVLGTEWFLRADRPDLKPMEPGLGCVAWQAEAVADSVAAILARSGNRRTIVLGHHPLVTGGEHGGFFAWQDHLFPLVQLHHYLWVPLPVLGTAYPVTRSLGVSSQDLSSGRYQKMVGLLAGAFRGNPPLLYAAGHEHNLQVIDGPYGLQLVSGSGIRHHQSRVTGILGTCLALSEAGYMRLDVDREGRVRLGVVTVNQAGQAREVWSVWLDPDRQKEQAVCGTGEASPSGSP